MRATKIVLVTAVAVAAPLLTSCSSSKGGATHTSGAAAPSPSTSQLSTPTTSSAPPSTSSAPAAGGLSGSWSGSYSGSYSGTFTLSWTQNGSTLAGTIDLSTSGRAPLTGTVNGDRITFGTVGSAAIAYTGTVSGNAMSGSYSIAGGAGGTGSWSAHRG